MKRKKLLTTVLLGFWLASFWMSAVFAQSVDDLMIMTESYPPLNFEKDGQLQGIAVDIMVLLLEKLDSAQTRENIRLLPWARAYKYVQTRENNCLFSMVRTEAREDLFKWVGPIAPSRIVLTAPKYKNIKIESFDDLNKYRIGVVIDDIGELLLVERGIEKGTLIAVSNPVLCARQLERGRIDLWAYGDIIAKWLLKEEGFPSADYEAVYVLDENELYFAFHKETPDALIQQFQSALDELREQGEVQKIMDKYLK